MPLTADKPRRRPGPPHVITTADVLSQLPGTAGLLTQIAERLQSAGYPCHASTVGRLRDSDPTLRAAIDAERESALDRVECTLYKSAVEGDTHAARLIMHAHARARGYDDRPQVQIDNRQAHISLSAADTSTLSDRCEALRLLRQIARPVSAGLLPGEIDRVAASSVDDALEPHQ